MCFSDSKQISKQRQSTLKQLGDERKKYMKDKELSTYTICMLEYMEKALECTGYSVKQQKNVLSCFPCCGPSEFRNVRKEFQKAFQSCSNTEQFEFYRKFVNYMTEKEIPPPLALAKPSIIRTGSSIIVLNNNQQFTFNVQTKGSFFWNSQSTMTIIPDRYCLTIKSLTQAKQMNLNLRNYILRKSKHSTKANAFVLCGIVPIDPLKVRFSIPKQNADAPAIIGKIFQLSDRALQQNVLVWRQPIKHITHTRITSDAKQPKIKLLQGDQPSPKKKGELEAPSVKVIGTKDINNPLKNMVLDKAKIQLQKKVRDYNETIVDPNSKRASISIGIQNGSSRGSPKNLIQNQTLRKKNNLNLMNEDQIPEDKGEDAVSEARYSKENKMNINNVKNTTSNTLIQNLLNLNNDAFKKKPKLAMSENNDGQLSFVNNTKKKSQQKKSSDVKNYAMQPTHTRSEAGSKKYLKQDALSRIQKKSEEEEQQIIDSGKSLLYQLDQGIDQQQQFGNVSELSKDSVDNSFQTIPDMMR